MRTGVHNVGWGSSVGIATRKGLGGPGIESRWGRDFPHPSRPAPRTQSASYTMCIESFPGVKWSGRGVDHPSSAEVKERAEPYLYSTSGPSWTVTGWTVQLLVYTVWVDTHKHTHTHTHTHTHKIHTIKNRLRSSVNETGSNYKAPPL